MTACDALLGPSYRRHARLIGQCKKWTTAEPESGSGSFLSSVCQRYDFTSIEFAHRIPVERETEVSHENV